MPKAKTNDLLGTRDVARVLDMSPDTVAEFARKSIIRGTKHGRQWKFKKRDVFYFAQKMGDRTEEEMLAAAR